MINYREMNVLLNNKCWGGHFCCKTYYITLRDISAVRCVGSTCEAGHTWRNWCAMEEQLLGTCAVTAVELELGGTAEVWVLSPVPLHDHWLDFHGVWHCCISSDNPSKMYYHLSVFISSLLASRKSNFLLVLCVVCVFRLPTMWLSVPISTVQRGESLIQELWSLETPNL